MNLIELRDRFYGARVLTNVPDVVEHLQALAPYRSPILKHVHAAMESLERTTLRVETLLIYFDIKDGKIYIRALPGPDFVDTRLLSAPGTESFSMEDLCNARAGAAY